MRHKAKWQFAVTGLCIALLTACGGGDGSSGAGSGTPTSFTAVSGVAQKGPLIKTSTVTAQELNGGLVPTGKSYNFQINSDLGTFSPNASFGSQYIGLTATGYYFDEVKGSVSASTITLNGIADLSSSTVLNVNLLTTLAYQRIQTLVGGGLPVSAATVQAENEVLAALHIAGGAGYGMFSTLDLSQAGNGNKILVAVSALFVQAADTAAGTSGNASGQLASLMAAFQSDIADNGKIDTAATMSALSAAGKALSPSAVAANLTSRYASVSLAFAATDITNWVDTTSDGVPGAFRFTASGGASASSFTIPAGLVSALVGTTVTASSGQLVVDGSTVSSAVIAAGDTVTISMPQAAVPQSAQNVYLLSNGTPVAEVPLTQPAAPTQNYVALLAGSLGSYGTYDATGSLARFGQPAGMAMDASGNLFVADQENATIRKVTPSGVVTTVAGSSYVRGSANGTGTAATFNRPAAVALDGAGNLYIADRANDTIRVMSPGGAVTTLAGSAGVTGSTDATGSAARFNQPDGIAVDGAGNVFVADGGNSTIRKIASGGVVSTFAGTAGSTGSTDATGTAARFNGVGALTIDSAGNLYVVDTGNNTLRKITPGGVVTTLAGTAGTNGSADGTGPVARFRFNGQAGLAVDGAGNVYVSDEGNQTVRRVTPAGVVTTIAGTATPLTCSDSDGTGAAAGFCSPMGITVDGDGNLFVSDSGGATIRKITSAGVVTTLAGQAPVMGGANGTGSTAQLSQPAGPAVDASGNIYLADQFASTIRKITPAGVVTTVAGTFNQYGSTNGTGSAARFMYPQAVAVDSTGTLYVADTDNQTIRKITTGGVVSTLAGSTGVTGAADGTGSAAQFSGPVSLAVDASGNVYVAESGNNTIRKITPAGVVSTLAGTAYAAYSGGTVTCQYADGNGAAARFCSPQAVTVDAGGNVYVADSGNNVIRKITPAGIVSTIAGTAYDSTTTPCHSSDGTGPAAGFCFPNGVALDGAGNLFVTDAQNGTIRKVTPAGVVSTVIGTVGAMGNVVGAVPAVINPFDGGLAINASGQLIFVSGNAVVISEPGF